MLLHNNAPSERANISQSVWRTLGVAWTHILAQHDHIVVLASGTIYICSMYAGLCHLRIYIAYVMNLSHSWCAFLTCFVWILNKSMCVYVSILSIPLSALGSCLSYGHSCWGGKCWPQLVFVLFVSFCMFFEYSVCMLTINTAVEGWTNVCSLLERFELARVWMF